MGFWKDLFGPREPCALCHLGQESWPSDRSGSADWKIRGQGLHVELLVCVPCRKFLLDTGLIHRTPMLALAALVSHGAAVRPPLAAYLQHPGWRTIWLHALEISGLRPSDEFAALQMIRPLEEEFIQRAGAGQAQPAERRGDSNDGLATDPVLQAMIDEYGIPDELVKQKYVSYALALRMSGRSSHWNGDVDDHGLRIGAVTREDVIRARTDIHQAILNRIKIAFVAEGWYPVHPEDSEDG